MPAPSKPPAVNIDIDLPATVAALKASKNPDEILRGMLQHVAASVWQQATDATARSPELLGMFQNLMQKSYRLGFDAGRRKGMHTLSIPAELSAALRKLAEDKQAPAPVINVPAPVVQIDNQVIVPSRTVKATTQNDGSVLMVPQP